MKIAISTGHGGFWLSALAVSKLVALGLQLTEEVDPLAIRHWGISDYGFEPELARDDPRLIQVIEALGDEAGHGYSKLKAVEIPDDVKWEICTCEGAEWIAEAHRKWS